MNYDVPLNSCHISCPWVNWASVFMDLKLSSYLEIFQPIIMKFFALFYCLSLPVGFHLQIFLYSLHIFSFKCLWWTFNFFPKSFHSCFPCLYLTYSIFFSFMNIQIVVLVSILMSFPANYVMYILTVFLLIDFSFIMDIFLLLCTLGVFFLFQCLYLS